MFANQLPEVFGGFRRDAAEIPVEYADALKPQAWAAAAPLFAIRILLGLDVVDGRLRAKLQPTERISRLRLTRVPVRGRSASAG